jgi:hypothetical protein
MPKRLQPICVSLCVLLVAWLLASCSVSKVGTIPSGTPDRGNGTPAVMPTPDPPPVTAAPPNTTGAFYAFVRKNQLWVALKGASPVQVTNFDFRSVPNIFWHAPAWSPQDHFIAVIVNAVPFGLGGGGCPGPDYGANGALYVLNTATKQFSQVTFPSVIKNIQMSGSPRNDYWQYVFWEDATHLLAWYNGVPEKTGTAAGLYRYDVKTQVLTRVIPLSALGVATLFSPQKDTPLLLSLRYSNEQLFYQAVVHPFEQQSQVIIYSHSVLHPTMQSSILLQVGTEPWCTTPQGGPFVRPGWDVSPNGEQLVAQMIVANGSNQGVGTVQALDLNDSSTTGLFAQAPRQLLDSDLTLTWGPDSQTVVATTARLIDYSGPYTASLANPAAMQQYVPSVAGPVSWRPDSAAFALQNMEMIDVTTRPDVYVFLTGDSHGRMLLTDAQNFTWG